MKTIARILRFSCTATLVWAGTGCGAPANQAPLATIEEVTSPATGPAGEPNLVTAPDGRIYVSWIERQSDSTHALRFAVWNGETMSAARTVAIGTRWFVNWADFPMMAVLSDGTLAAHWLQRSGSGRYAYDVKIALSRDDGHTWSAGASPHRDGTESEHGFVSLFPLADRFGVVWLDGRKHAAAQQRKSSGEGNGEDGEMTVRFTTLLPDGQFGEEVEIDGRACDCCQTSVAVTAEGPMLVYRDRSPDEIRDISVARWQNGQWTAGRPVQSDNWQVNFCPVNGPSAAASGRDAAVAWFTAAQDSPRVFVAFSADAGATFQPGIRVDEGAPLGRVDVVMLNGNTALVSWLERTGERSAEIRVRRVHAGGRLSPVVVVSASSPDRPGGFPHMAVSGNRVLFAWTEPGETSSLRVASAWLP